MNQEKFSLKARGRSFRYAFKGMATLVRDQHNARIHLCAAIVAVTAGILLHIDTAEWIAVTFAIAAVFAAEAFNSAVEYLADFVSPAHHPLIGKAKDIAAAAVLFMAIAAAIVGCIIFIPRIIPLLS